MARRDGYGLSLDGLSTLSTEVAEALADCQGEAFLSLDGLTTLTPEAAEALAPYEGNISPYGLKTLSPKAVEALARHEGYRWLLPPWSEYR